MHPGLYACTSSSYLLPLLERRQRRQLQEHHERELEFAEEFFPAAGKLTREQFFQHCARHTKRLTDVLQVRD